MENILKKGACSGVVNLQTPTFETTGEEGTVTMIVPLTFAIKVEAGESEFIPVCINQVDIVLPDDIENIMMATAAPYFTLSYNHDSHTVSIVKSNGDA